MTLVAPTGAKQWNMVDCLTAFASAAAAKQCLTAAVARVAGGYYGYGTSQWTKASAEAVWEAGGQVLPIFFPTQTELADFQTVAQLDKYLVSISQVIGGEAKQQPIASTDIEESTWEKYASLAIGHCEGWIELCQKSGWRSMVYGPAALLETLAERGHPPTAIWLADWVEGVTDIYQLPGIPAGQWDGPNQRAIQHLGNATLGGHTVDLSLSDVPGMLAP